MSSRVSVFPFVQLVLLVSPKNHGLIQGLVPAPLVRKTALSSLHGLGISVQSQLILVLFCFFFPSQFISSRRLTSSFVSSSQWSGCGHVVSLRLRALIYTVGTEVLLSWPVMSRERDPTENEPEDTL